MKAITLTAVLLCLAQLGSLAAQEVAHSSDDAVVVRASSQEPCGASAPTSILSEFNNGCSSDVAGRFLFSDLSTRCPSAMHRFCLNVRYGKTVHSPIGLVREHYGNHYDTACVAARYVGPFHPVPGYVAEEQRRKYCNTGRTNEVGCLYAAEQFCSLKLGFNHAGYVPDDHTYACIPTTVKQWVAFSVLSQYNGACSSWERGPTAHCYSAASRFCQRNYPGSTGGLPQGVTKISGVWSVFVACYKSEYEGMVYGARDKSYYDRQNTASDICEFRFALDKAKILAAVPKMIKQEFYDNRRSSTTMHETFEVSGEETITSSFTRESSVTIGVEVSVSVSVPFLVDSEVKTSVSNTRTLSFTQETSETKTWSKTSTVEVPPHKAIYKEARITRTQMDVPYFAKVRTQLGTVRNIHGVWRGVDVSDIHVTQWDA